MAFNLQNLNWALICLAWRYTVERCCLDWSFHQYFCLRKRCTRLTLWRPNDIRKFDADTILFIEIWRKKRDILMFKRCFQCGLGWNQVKYARIMITHVCFITLILAGSLGRCLNTRPDVIVFKQLPVDLVNVNAWKTICDPYFPLCFSHVECNMIKSKYYAIHYPTLVSVFTCQKNSEMFSYRVWNMKTITKKYHWKLA